MRFFVQKIWNHWLMLLPWTSKVLLSYSLQEINSFRFLQEINLYILIKTYDIRWFIIIIKYLYTSTALKYIYFHQNKVKLLKQKGGFPNCNVIMMSYWELSLKIHVQQWVYHKSRYQTVLKGSHVMVLNQGKLLKIVAFTAYIINTNIGYH